jgi:flavorubredoxin
MKEDTLNAREIVPGVFWMGAQDFDRRLFDELIPLPDGTSYNAYLVKGSEKTALIDTVDPAKIDLLMAQLESVPRLDFLIVQHVEQDHSGSVPAVLDRYPNATIITTPKAKPMLVDHLQVDPERIVTVKDGETLPLGDRTLEFIHAPWVHWPETMFTHLREEKILFTCDFLGSHLATTELYGREKERVYEAAKRYYAEIMMPFRAMIKGHLEKLARYEIEIIAPSHGPLYDDPSFILDAYRGWVLDPPKNLAVLPYVSMHGSTEAMVEHLVSALVDRGVRTEPFNMTVTDLGKLAITLVDAATVIFATPTLLVGPHPSIVSAAYLTNALRPKLKHAAVIGSYGWAGKAAEQTTGLLKSLKLEWFDPVMVKGFPDGTTLQALDRLAEAIAKRHQSLS